MSGCSAITASDRLILNIADPNPSRKHHTESIDELVAFTIIPKGGGDVRIICRSSADTKHVSRSLSINSVEICYKIGDTEPNSTEDAGTKRFYSTLASFTLALGTANICKKIYVFARWYNFKHPELAGHWSAIHQAVIA